MNDMTITVPKNSAYSMNSLQLILPNSPMKHRKYVETFARYFKHEFHYDFVQFCSLDTEGYEAYLFADLDYIFGATCFRYRTYDNHDPFWAMQWIWLHPYKRHEGVLTRAWPKFIARYGHFRPEPPLSIMMTKFLHDLGYSWEGEEE